MDVNDIHEHLLAAARALRPVGKPFVSVLKVAHELGATVKLRLERSRAVSTAQIDVRDRPPNIILYRPASVDGEREVRLWEEGLLTPRERFSVAHELGHWIVYREFKTGIHSDKRMYWMQEEAINAFAGLLLVPDWLVARWFEEIPTGTPVPPFALRYWANTQCRCSEEVVAKSLAHGRNSIGFLKLLVTKRARDGSHVLKVLCSAGGSALSLPSEHSHISDANLLDLFRNEVVGQARLKGLSLGRCKPQDLRVAWRRGKPLKSEDTIWASIAVDVTATDLDNDPRVQLSMALEPTREPGSP
jgi:hypothetical protein